MLMRKVLYTTILTMIVLSTVISPVMATWANGGSEAPYQGIYTNWAASGPEIVSYAYDMKWTQAAINDMKWDGNMEVIDQTADCTTDNNYGDRLHTQTASTNIPNDGISGFNDCGVYHYFEESELRINPHSLNTTTSYWELIHWSCVYGGAWGALNITFEANPFHHGWLAKTGYGCGYNIALDSPALIIDDSTVEKAAGSIEQVTEINNNAFSYVVIYSADGQVQIRSNVDFNSREALRNYIQENDIIFDNLISMPPIDDIMVTVTFTDPVSINQAQQFIQESKIDLESYGIFGVSEGDVVSTYVFPLSNIIEGYPLGEANTRYPIVRYDGIMTMTGYVSTRGLQYMKASPGIGLLDITGNIIMKEVAEMHQIELVSIQKFSTPNPAWIFYTDANQSE